jgi:hypothetical protein
MSGRAAKRAKPKAGQRAAVGGVKRGRTTPEPEEATKRSRASARQASREVWRRRCCTVPRDRSGHGDGAPAATGRPLTRVCAACLLRRSPLARAGVGSTIADCPCRRCRRSSGALRSHPMPRARGACPKLGSAMLRCADSTTPIVTTTRRRRRS